MLIAIVEALVWSPGAREATILPSNGLAQITLTAGAPDGELYLPSIAAELTGLQLEVTRIENPSMQGLAIELRLRFDRAGRESERLLGAFALYPSDRPGEFTISLPLEVRKLVAGQAGSIRLLVHLTSPVAGRPLVEPLKVSLGTPQWR